MVNLGPMRMEIDPSPGAIKTVSNLAMAIYALAAELKRYNDARDNDVIQSGIMNFGLKAESDDIPEQC